MTAPHEGVSPRYLQTTSRDMPWGFLSSASGIIQAWACPGARAGGRATRPRTIQLGGKESPIEGPTHRMTAAGGRPHSTGDADPRRRWNREGGPEKVLGGRTCMSTHSVWIYYLPVEFLAVVLRGGRRVYGQERRRAPSRASPDSARARQSILTSDRGRQKPDNCVAHMTHTSASEKQSNVTLRDGLPNVSSHTLSSEGS